MLRESLGASRLPSRACQLITHCRCSRSLKGREYASAHYMIFAAKRKDPVLRWDAVSFEEFAWGSLIEKDHEGSLERTI